MSATSYQSLRCFSTFESLSSSDLGSRGFLLLELSTATKPEEEKHPRWKLKSYRLPSTFSSPLGNVLGSQYIAVKLVLSLSFLIARNTPKETFPSCPVAPQKAAVVCALKPLAFLTWSVLPVISGVFTSDHDKAHRWDATSFGSNNCCFSDSSPTYARNIWDFCSLSLRLYLTILLCMFRKSCPSLWNGNGHQTIPILVLNTKPCRPCRVQHSFGLLDREGKIEFCYTRMWDRDQATAAVGTGWGGGGIEKSRAETEGGCGTCWDI